MKTDIGLRVKSIRESLKMNKEQFAKLIGLSGQYLGEVEKGSKGLSLDKLINICQKTSVSSDYILFGKINNIDPKIKEMFININENQIVDIMEIIKKVALYLQNNK